VDISKLKVPGYHMLVDTDRDDLPALLGVPTALRTAIQGAKVRHVDGAGGAEFTTISAAITASIDGDVILIAPGSYPEKLNVSKRITLLGAPTSATLGTANGNPGVTINPVLLTTEAGLIASAAVPATIIGLWFIPTFAATTGTFYGVRLQLAAEFYNCKFGLTDNGGNSVDVNAYTIHCDSAAGQSQLNNCFVEGPSGPLSVGTGAIRALIVNGSSISRLRVRDTRFFTSTPANKCVIEVAAAARGYFFGIETDNSGGDFLITSATDWFLSPDSYIGGTRTTTGTPSIEGVAVDGSLWLDTTTKQVMARQGGANVPLFNPYVGQHSLAFETLSDNEPPFVPAIKGDTGATGTTGAQGPVGPAVFLLGDEGPEGEHGSQGTIGPQGATGTTGAQGPTGPAVFLLDETIDGEAGIPGQPGAQGVQGITGAQGPVGPAVFLLDETIDGEIGPLGPTGPQGATGTQSMGLLIMFSKGAVMP
jgi:hypothetical protein